MTAKLFLDDAYQTHCDAKIIAVGDKGIQLDKTVFYATSGGQPGDVGSLIVSNQNIPVMGAIKGEGLDDIWHLLPEGMPAPSIGDSVQGQIDWALRHKHMRMHTLLHLIVSQIKGDITGCQIGAEKSRVDFNIETGAVDKDELSVKINDMIVQDYPISAEWITDEELAANPQLIRTMSVKPPVGAGKVRLVRIGTKDNTVDIQPCGGTHVRSTAEVGPVVITKLENKGAKNRRISVVFAE